MAILSPYIQSYVLIKVKKFWDYYTEGHFCDLSDPYIRISLIHSKYSIGNENKHNCCAIPDELEAAWRQPL